jgi:hypothetical protein
VKRRQADGRTLAEIQAELAGATDATLAGIARVPDELLADDGSTATSPPGNDRTADGSATDAPAEDAMAGTVRARFWVSAPAAATDRPPPDRARREAPGAAPDPSLTPTPPAVIDSTWTDSLSVTLSDDGAAPVHYSRAVPLAGVALGGGAVLLVPGRPADDDYDAIAAAARPLVELLATRGLLASRADAAHGLPGVGGSPPIAGTRAHPDSGRLTHHDGSSR